MEKVDQVSSIFCFGLGLAVVFGSYRLGLGAMTRPGPGFLTFWCSIILCGLSLLVFFRAILSRRVDSGRKISQLWLGMHWQKPIYVVISLIIYVFALDYLGFLLATIVLLIFLFKAIEPETWTRAIVSGILAGVACYGLFGVWLQVQLPRGLLGFF